MLASNWPHEHHAAAGVAQVVGQAQTANQKVPVPFPGLGVRAPVPAPARGNDVWWMLLSHTDVCVSLPPSLPSL